jgi:hypothetical protein
LWRRGDSWTSPHDHGSFIFTGNFPTTLIGSVVTLTAAGPAGPALPTTFIGNVVTLTVAAPAGAAFPTIFIDAVVTLTVAGPAGTAFPMTFIGPVVTVTLACWASAALVVTNTQSMTHDVRARMERERRVAICKKTDSQRWDHSLPISRPRTHDVIRR